MSTNGSMPHDTTEHRRDRFLSRASSRKELAGTVHDLILPALGQLQHNDRVTQDVCKGLLETVKAQGEQIARDAQRLTAFTSMPFWSRLLWAFDFSTKEAK